MKNHYLNIYNNLIKLTRNKNLYLKLEKKDTFSDRLILLFFHLGFFLKTYKFDVSKKELQNLFDYIIRQIEISIREAGYGDASVNKKMKDFVNLFYSIINKIEIWESFSFEEKSKIFENYLNFNKNLDYFVDYYDRYIIYLSKNTLNNFTKDILNLKF